MTFTSPAPTSSFPLQSSSSNSNILEHETTYSPDAPSLYDSSSPQWDMSDRDLYLHFLADLEQLDAWFGPAENNMMPLYY